MLDLAKLENVKGRGSKIIARCPACSELSADKRGEHLAIMGRGAGPFTCIANQGPDGAEHRRRIFQLAGLCDGAHPKKPAPVYFAPAVRSPEVSQGPRLPSLRVPSITDLSAIARQRNWSLFAGLGLLVARQLLWVGDVYDDGGYFPSWIITDSARRNAQARRMDGRPWRGIGDKKAKSIPGSKSAWPIGSVDIGSRPFVVLCEGQPDFAAALFVAWWEELPVDQVAPVCIAGTGPDIDADALVHFRGKHVIIPPHDDPTGVGQEAAAKWARQLYRAGAARVNGFDFNEVSLADGRPCKDLADYATLLQLPEDEATRSVPPGVYHVFSSFAEGRKLSLVYPPKPERGD